MGIQLACSPMGLHVETALKQLLSLLHASAKHANLPQSMNLSYVVQRTRHIHSCPTAWSYGRGLQCPISMPQSHACEGKISALTAHGTGPSPGENAARYSSRPGNTRGMYPEGHPALYAKYSSSPSPATQPSPFAMHRPPDAAPATDAQKIHPCMHRKVCWSLCKQVDCHHLPGLGASKHQQASG